MTSSVDTEIDYYALLDIPLTATEKEISSAYRKKSLKVHPDRNPDNPQAAALFHDLTIASQILLDPIKRSQFDQARALKRAKKERFSKLDSNRRQLAEDLERREKQFREGKKEGDEKDRKRKLEVERLKEQGRKMRQEKERLRNVNVEKEKEEMLDRIKEEKRRKLQSENGVVELGLMDTTLTIKWDKSKRGIISSSGDVRNLVQRLLGDEQEPEIDAFLSEDKIPKGGCSVKFRTLSAAVKLMDRSQSRPSSDDRDWQGVTVDWAGKRPPEILLGKESTKSAAPVIPPFTAPSISTSTISKNDESDILARLRQKEREKLMEQMRREDEAAEA